MGGLRHLVPIPGWIPTVAYIFIFRVLGSACRVFARYLDIYITGVFLDPVQPRKM